MWITSDSRRAKRCLCAISWSSTVPTPDRMARFWAAALGYELAPPPAGFDTWNDFYRALDLPEDDLVDGADRISDPDGHGPSVWFHVVPDTKTVKNRLHLDIHASGARATRSRSAGSGSTRRPSRLARLGRHDHWRTVSGGSRPLRGRHEGPRRQRVRHQLTSWSKTPELRYGAARGRRLDQAATGTTGPPATA